MNSADMKVQQSHSCEGDALLEAAGVAPVTPAGWEESKKSMFRVGCILDNAFHPASLAGRMIVRNMAYMPQSIRDQDLRLQKPLKKLDCNFESSL